MSDVLVKTTVGCVHPGEEFRYRGRWYKRVGTTLHQLERTNSLEPIHILPDVRTHKLVQGHQNAIRVQEIATGCLFWMNTWYKVWGADLRCLNKASVIVRESKYDSKARHKYPLGW